MGKPLSGAAFSKAVVSRVRRERPDIRVETLGDPYTLLVEPRPGRWKLVSLRDLYYVYRDSPVGRDAVVGSFLEDQIYREPPEIRGTLTQNLEYILPQVVPIEFLDMIRADERDVVGLPFAGDLGLIYVRDFDMDGHAHMSYRQMDEWGIDEVFLLRAAIDNLRKRSSGGLNRFEQGSSRYVSWGIYDGYDASRLLLIPELTEAAATLSGTPVIAVPHRDHLVMFGDGDPRFVSLMSRRIKEEHASSLYPLSTCLYTITNGVVRPYQAVHGLRSAVN